MSTRVLQRKPAGPMVRWILPLTVSGFFGLGVAGCAHGQAIKDLPAAAPEPPAIKNVNAPAEMIEAAMADAENRSTTARADITVLSAEAVTWPDGSLGCPQPGMMYTQALVPGFRIVLHAGEQTLNYHAMSRGKPVFCPAGRVAAPAAGQGISAASEAEHPAETALAGAMKVALDDAARRTKIDSSRPEVMTAESVLWPNGALGCPQDDTMYTQAAVRGYRIRIRAGEQVLDYHAGVDGKPSLCPRGQATDALPERLLSAPANPDTDRVTE